MYDHGIAEHRIISPSTAATRMRSIRRTTGVERRSDLALQTVTDVG